MVAAHRRRGDWRIDASAELAVRAGDRQGCALAESGYHLKATGEAQLRELVHADGGGRASELAAADLASNPTFALGAEDLAVTLLAPIDATVAAGERDDEIVDASVDDRREVFGRARAGTPSLGTHEGRAIPRLTPSEAQWIDDAPMSPEAADFAGGELSDGSNLGRVAPIEDAQHGKAMALRELRQIAVVAAARVLPVRTDERVLQPSQCVDEAGRTGGTSREDIVGVTRGDALERLRGDASLGCHARRFGRP